MAARYDHQRIEKEAQEKWAALDLYTTDLKDTSKDPYYLLFEFPYPSGDLHIGHWYAFAVTDIFARYLRMKGKNVLFPIGFDAFGLPAENAAIKNGVDPREWTYANMDRMRAQIKTMGTSVDWSKEVVTCDPAYYKWTQWLFAKLYEHGLAERKEAAVKWCPKDKTVLANEQVIDGYCERCGSVVEEKLLTQWFMKITQYAERLLNDLDALPWREEIKDAQRAWIGKSEGARLSFKLVPAPDTGSEDAAAMPQLSLDVFTTRPDTIFGATYVVMAPEHPYLNELLETLGNETDVAAYIELTKSKTERERQEEKEKTGVRLEGIMAVNPATKELIPVYVADYVLGSYGTGAVMAVPAHDERDFAFAQKHSLPMKQVVVPRFVDHANPWREGRKMVERNAILAIVRNPETGKYLGLKWKKLPWTTFITGGIDEGEDAVEAARREVHEETGYKNLKFVRSLGMTRSEFYAEHKDLNRTALNSVMLFDLENDERDPVGEEEFAQHEPYWLSFDDIAAEKMRHSEIEFIRSRMQQEDSAYIGDGVLVDSGEFSGRDNREAMMEIAKAVGGTPVTNYRIRDWLVSRQRYWGCPIPVVYDPEGRPHVVPADHLPWLLPTDVDFTPNDAGSPLATSKELKERVIRIFGEGWTPEYDTLDTFVDSSWYYLRYVDPNDAHDFSDQKLLKKWLPVDRYSGGSEHTTMHLLYARFFHKALYDLALVPTPEPFNERYNRGIILGPDGAKMSKSKGNVINPDDVVKEHGADAVRLYLAFIGPYNEPGHYPWNLDGVASMRKFLDRIFALYEKLEVGHPMSNISEDVQRMLAKAEAKAAADSERFKFNTAISALMVLVRDFEGLDSVPQNAYRDLVRMLAPFAPHLAEHLWQNAGGEGSVHAAMWPAYDAALLTEDSVTVVVQVNGKRRGDMQVKPDASEAEVLSLARDMAPVAAALGNREPQKVIYVPGKILNLVV